MASKKKVMTSVAAVATAAAVMFGGTFAWQSTNQTALNEASDIVNPGGRLHDDFNGTNKDVYVENFADDDIFARVKLSEYFEIIMNYNTDAVVEETLAGSKTQQVVDGTPVTDDEGKPVYDYTYATHYFGLTDDEKAAGTASEEGGEVDNLAYTWWNWTTDGSTLYLPTFNMNKDSLQADVNGVYVDAIGGISNRDEKQYDNYLNYNDLGLDYPIIGTEIYDGDTDPDDEVGADLDNAAAYPDAVILAENQEHKVKSTQEGTLISMTDWLAQVEADGGYDAAKHGNNWVYDEDGWVYWSAPIPAGEATGLLLNEIGLVDPVMDDTWYYAIEVVGQFVTADDVGNVDDSGFYNTMEGTVPTENAEKLLDLIGVEMGETDSDVTPMAIEMNWTSNSTDLITNPTDVAVLSSAAGVFSATLSVTQDGQTVEGVTYETSSTDLIVDENGAIALAEGVTMTKPLEYYTVSALVDGAVVATQDVYMIDSTQHSLDGITQTETANYLVLLHNTDVNALPVAPTTYACVYRMGDAVENIYYYNSYQGNFYPNDINSQVAEGIDAFYADTETEKTVCTAVSAE